MTEKFRPSRPAAATEETDPEHPEDLRLMQQVAAKEPAAARQLAERLAPRVHRVARSILRQSADADDATQQSLIEILASAKSYRGGASIERWSDRITVRTTMRVARERRKQSGRLEGGIELDDLVAESPSAGAGDATPRRAGEYLAELPDKQRDALVMRHVMGYSIAEIAELTDSSPNTVKDRLLRGAREMRRLIRRDVAIGTTKKGPTS